MKLILRTLFSLFLGISCFYCHLAEASAVKEPLQLEQEQTIQNNHPSAPCAIVIFGATGDLTARKLLPAIYHLAHEGHLSEQTMIIGFARGSHTHESFAQLMENAIDQFSRMKSKDLTFWNQFKNKIFYQQSSFENDEGYQELEQLLAEIDQKYGTQGNRIYYLATQPSYFPTIIEKLHAHHLIYDVNQEKDKWSRVMIEKPFGSDLQSAIQLQAQLSKHLDESQIYRLDHYLGKEGVQNLIALRFQNALFEPLWNHQFIDHVQITLGEEIGIGSRANFWEETGALRDVFQNHLMQLLALVAMEPPQDFHFASMQEERIKVLNAIRAFPLAEIDNHVIRGQYGQGVVQSVVVPGYKQEKGVSSQSTAETFIAAKLFIDNPRWEGVPFYIRGGKRLAKQTTEIAIIFKKHAFSLHQDSNVLFIRIQPNAGIFLKTVSKVPGLDHFIAPVLFGYNPEAIFGKSSPEAYEKLFCDCIRGNSHLFVAVEEQLAAWRLLTPVLEYWRKHATQEISTYDAGTWGPAAADYLLLQNGHQWQLLGR